MFATTINGLAVCPLVLLISLLHLNLASARRVRRAAGAQTRYMNSMISRREALRRTVLFSTGLMAARWVAPLHAAAPTTHFADDGLDLLAIGDFGTGNAAQSAVAAQMAAFAQT